MSTNSTQNPDQIVKNFLGTLEKVIGTDDTLHLLDSLTGFFRETPETLIEIQAEIKKDPLHYKSLLTAKNVENFKETYAMLKDMGITGMF